MSKFTLEQLQEQKASLDKRKSALEAEEIVLRNEKERLQREIKSLGYNSLAELSSAAQKLEEEISHLLGEYESLLSSEQTEMSDIEAI